MIFPKEGGEAFAKDIKKENLVIALNDGCHFALESHLVSSRSSSSMLLALERKVDELNRVFDAAFLEQDEISEQMLLFFKKFNL